MPFIDPDLEKFERKVYSQFGEDGVIEELVRSLGIQNGTFFEFGIGPAYQHPIEDGLEGNFVLLREKGWIGTFVDGNEYPSEYNVIQALVTPLNINDFFGRFAIPKNLDLMSIDVDGQEFWIWMALMARPKIVVIEYNGSRDKYASITVQFDVDFRWDVTDYHGASLLALSKLGSSKGYMLVWSNGVNAIFVRDDFVSNKEDFSYERVHRSFPAIFGPDPQGRPWVQI